MKLIECVNEETGQQAATEYIEGDEQVNVYTIHVI